MLLPVFVLPATVVCMQLKVAFSKTVCLQVVVKEGDDAVCTLAHIHSLVNEVIDLLILFLHKHIKLKLFSCLVEYCLAAHSENPTLPRSQKKDWAWLLWIVGNVYLCGNRLNFWYCTPL